VKSIFVSLLTAVFISATANAGTIKGVLLNDDDPYIVKTRTGFYKIEWYSGSSLFSEGDVVIITTEYGMGEMISLSNEETARVWVEEIDD
jgi:hypothetical protein